VFYLFSLTEIGGDYLHILYSNLKKTIETKGLL